MNTKELKTALRQGPYAWPGGYPTYFLCNDGGVLCHHCVRDNFREIISAIRTGDYRCGWFIYVQDINWEDPYLLCDHCGERIPSAYMEDEYLRQCALEVCYHPWDQPRGPLKQKIDALSAEITAHIYGGTL